MKAPNTREVRKALGGYIDRSVWIPIRCNAASQASAISWQVIGVVDPIYLGVREPILQLGTLGVFHV